MADLTIVLKVEVDPTIEVQRGDGGASTIVVRPAVVVDRDEGTAVVHVRIGR